MATKSGVVTAIVVPPGSPEGLEGALIKADAIETKLAPLKAKARSFEIKDKAGYLELGTVLTEVRGIRKNEITPLFSPFEGIVNRVKEFLSQQKNRAANLCEEIDGICVSKMKQWEAAEREAAAKEQATLQKKNPAVEVPADLPAIPGYRKTVNYRAVVTDESAFIKSFILGILHAADIVVTPAAKRKLDAAIQADALRKYIQVNQQKLGETAREMKDPDKMMAAIPAIRAWKE